MTEPLIVLGPSHGSRRLLDAAVSRPACHYGVAAETNVPQVAQALAAGGRGVAVVSDDPRYGLHGVPSAQRLGRELRVPLVAAWDGSHYAAAAIAALVDGLARFARARDTRARDIRSGALPVGDSR